MPAMPPPVADERAGLREYLAAQQYAFHAIAYGLTDEQARATPSVSAFLSAFFTLVGTHGLHVTFGSIWLVVLLIQVGLHGLTAENQRRVMCLSLFWHFLDLIWIGVFSFVYLAGVLQ